MVTNCIKYDSTLNRRLQWSTVWTISESLFSDHMFKWWLVSCPKQQHRCMHLSRWMGRRQLWLRCARVFFNALSERCHLCRTNPAKYKMLLSIRLHWTTMRDTHQPMCSTESLPERRCMHQLTDKCSRYSMPVSCRLHRQQVWDHYQCV